jgi:hypothetical protein
MKGIEMKNSKKIITTALLLAAGYTGLVSAHSVSGTVGISLTGAAATDVYNVTCTNNGGGVPTSLYLHVKDLAPILAPIVSTQANKSTATTVLSSDTVDGDANYSPALTLTPSAAIGGTGVYTVRVNKSASATVKGAEIYTLEYHCQAGTTHTGTAIALIQNQ